MDCPQCSCDLEKTIAFQTICCQTHFCAECLFKRTGRCNDMSCDNIHFKCYKCDKISNIPKHIIDFISLARNGSVQK